MAKKTTIKIITDASALAKEATLLAKNIGSVDKRIQTYLLSEIIHCEEHRNPTRLNEFFSAIRSSGARVSAMRNYVLAFGNFEEGVKEVKGKKVSSGKLVMRKTRKPALAQEMIDKASATFWTAYKAPSAGSEYDLKTKALAFVKSAFAHHLTREDIMTAIDEIEAEAKIEADKMIERAKAKAARLSKTAA